MKEIPVHCSFDQMVPIGDLIAHPKNPNSHPDEQIALLAKIIDGAGWRRPIRISKLSGYITAGHGALLAAQLLKCEFVPVDHQEYEDDRAEMMDLAADNRIAEFSETDDEILAELARDLQAANDLAENPVDLGLSGYDLEFLEDLANSLTGEDEEPEPPKKEPKPLFGSLLELIGKAIDSDADELSEYQVKITTQHPRNWKVDHERRTITFKKGDG